MSKAPQEQFGSGVYTGIGVVMEHGIGNLDESRTRGRADSCRGCLGRGQQERLPLGRVQAWPLQSIEENLDCQPGVSQRMDQPGAETRVGAMHELLPERLGLAQGG